MINLADPAREHAHHQDEFEAAALRVMRSGVFILGPEVEAFQQEFAAYCGARRVVGVSNGSDAIVVALQALGVGPGDEVITTAFSYFATASAIVRAGATPVFADIDLASFDIDAADVERRVTSRTKAIVAVHLFGRMADTDALGAVASKRGLKLIEDVAQAAGAERHGRRAGTVGDVGTFSFFPAKPLGCDGDGGACATSDAAVADAMTRVRVTGATAKNVHELPGGNYRLAPLQAAILRAKLPHYEGRLAKRRANAEVLRQGLRGVSELLVLPEEDPEGRHVYAQFTVRHPKRDALSAALRVKGVASEVYYPVPMPYQKVLSSLGHRAGEFPHTERACAEVLSIPVHSELSDSDVVRVVEAMRASLAEVESR